MSGMDPAPSSNLLFFPEQVRFPRLVAEKEDVEEIMELGDEDVIVDDETGIHIVVGKPVEESNIVAEKRFEIDLVVNAFAAELPVPTDAIDSLEMSVATAFLNLGRDMGPEQVRVVSSRDLMRFASQLPQPAAMSALSRMESATAEALLDEMAEPTGDALFAVMGERLLKAIGHDACSDLAEIIARAITVPLMARRTWLADHFGDRLWRSYHEALRLYIGFTLAGRRNDAETVAPFVHYFRNGNFPIGTLKDGTFLMVTA